MNVERWREKGATGFFNFLEDVRPMVPSAQSGFIQFDWPNEQVKEEVREALDGGYWNVVFCWPRRHGKTLVSALIIVWRFFTFTTERIGIVANSERQAVDTAFNTVRDIITETPYTKSKVSAGYVIIQKEKIEATVPKNIIQGFTSSPSSLFGKKLTVAQVSELHASRSLQIYQTLASSTIDSDSGMVLVDSTVGSRQSPLYALYKSFESGENDALYFSHISYEDVADAIENGPPWINTQAIKSLKLTDEVTFNAENLNKWSDSATSVFPSDVIASCIEDYPLDVTAIAQGRKIVVGGALDRAGMGDGGDSTVFAVVCKVVGQTDGEPHFYVLDASDFIIAADFNIKRRITKAKQDFGMKHIIVEFYQSMDIEFWCRTQGFESELNHATPGDQQIAFLAMKRAAAEGRLHIHPKFKTLLDEMSTFEYELRVGSGASQTKLKFEHARGHHDDHVYAVGWAMHSLRSIELNPYEMMGIQCNSTNVSRNLCLLNGGEHVPMCSENCRSFKKFKELYQPFSEIPEYSDYSLAEFFQHKVKNIGSHISKR